MRLVIALFFCLVLSQAKAASFIAVDCTGGSSKAVYTFVFEPETKRVQMLYSPGNPFNVISHGQIFPAFISETELTAEMQNPQREYVYRLSISRLTGKASAKDTSGKDLSLDCGPSKVASAFIKPLIVQDANDVISIVCHEVPKNGTPDDRPWNIGRLYYLKTFEVFSFNPINPDIPTEREGRIVDVAPDLIRVCAGKDCNEFSYVLNRYTGNRETFYGNKSYGMQTAECKSASPPVAAQRKF